MTSAPKPTQWCIDCRFFAGGQCRRFPPTTPREFPVVRADDWCGEFKERK